MSLRQAEASWRTAERIARELVRQLPAIEGVFVFGSVARGDETAWSDIDLLIVGTDSKLTPTRVLAKLPPNLRNRRLSLLYYTVGELERLLEAGSSFMAHLRSQGRILIDTHGVMERMMRASFSLTPSLDDDLNIELDRLKSLENLKQFNGNFLFGLSQLYAIGKSVVMLRLLEEGHPEFSRDKAFDAFRRNHPELQAEVQRIQELRPFYSLVTRRRPEPLPFPYKEVDGHVRAALNAIRTIASP